MTQSSTSKHIRISASSFSVHSFFSGVRAALFTGFAAVAFAAIAFAATSLGAQTQTPAPDTSAAPAAASQPAASTQPTPSIAVSNQKPTKTRKAKEDKVVASKDTKKEDKQVKKDNSLAAGDDKLPDKALYDKAQEAAKKGRYDVARLDLQTLLNTYTDSQYMMPAKLAIADSWFKEGGSAALTQAEQEYTDFITFFPNAPEAAEAQMRVGDIYFREMDKPDRDNTNMVKAEQAYRQMLQQFPESTLVPQAAQKLREVQEALASGEAGVAAFYATRQNWAATIARYQTVVDTYPLYSHMDDVLIGIGDAYETEARYYRTTSLPGVTPAARERLVSVYQHEAAAAYTKVVLEHSAAAHVEDARDRLAAMGLPIPTPTPEQLAASAALENSRGQYNLSKRAQLLILRKADTVAAATIGAPPLEDPKPTLAPTVYRQSLNTFYTALNPAAGPQPAANPAAQAAAAATPDTPAATPAAPLAFQDVPSASAAGTGASTVDTSVPTAASSGASAGSSMGIQIVQPSSTSPAPPATPPTAPPAFPGAAAADAAPGAAPVPAQANPAPAQANPAPAQANIDTGGIKPVGPAAVTPLAPVEKPAIAPDPINDAAGSPQTPVPAPSATGKNAKTPCDKADESCSNHKKKKGLAKLNPF
jgi:outer membrane protein assembly factor BamD